MVHNLVSEGVYLDLKRHVICIKEIGYKGN